jgi:large subunit ribosomal protein L24
MKTVNLKIKKGDEVLVKSGRDSGKKGKVIRVLPIKNRIVVEGLNMRKKHVRPKKSGEKGSTVSVPFSIHISNVQIICPSCSKPTRIGYNIGGKSKTRICKKCSNTIV